jgi:hypothetical protein
MELSRIERALRRGSPAEPVYRPVAIDELLDGGEARDRGAGRRSLALVGAATAVVVTATVVGLTLVRPATPTDPGAAPVPDRRCAAGDLEPRLADVEELGTGRKLDIAITRTGSGACLLGRALPVRVVEPTEDPTPVVADSEHALEHWPRAAGFVVLPEASVAHGVIEWSNHCGPRPTAPFTVRIELGDGTAPSEGVMVVAFPLMADSTPPACMADRWGSRVTPFTVTVVGDSPPTLAGPGADPYAGLPVCRRGDLVPLDAVVGTEATGEVELIVGRAGAGSCIVPSGWRAVLRDGSGAVLADSGAPQPSGWPATIASAETGGGVLALRWTNHCGAAPVWPLTLGVTFDGEPMPDVRVAPDIESAPACLDDALPPLLHALFLGT